MNTKTFQIALQLLLIATSFILIAIFWDKIPAVIPTHWDINGNPGKYMRKEYGIFILPGINLLSLILTVVLPIIDPKVKKRADVIEGGSVITPYLAFITVIIVFFTALFVWQLGASLNWFGAGTSFIPFIIPIMFIAIGNFLGTLRPSYYVGIRTPWTLENETVWVKTHRMAGYLWVLTSLVAIVGLVLAPTNLYSVIMGVYLCIIILVPVFYSFMLSKHLTESQG